jgi:hypothetical protein
MDPVSLTASVIAMIGLAKEIITVCTNYIQHVKDAPKDLRSILIEVGSVKCVLETLRLCPELLPLFQANDSGEGPLDGCDQALKHLSKLILGEKTTSKKRKKSKLAVTFAELAWPLKEAKARKTLEELGRHKAAIILILTTDAG